MKHDFDRAINWLDHQCDNGCHDIIKFALRFTKAAMDEPSPTMLEVGDAFKGYDGTDLKISFMDMVAQLVKEVET